MTALTHSEYDTMMTSWSYSRLQIFEQCKLRAKIQYIDKVPEPERPLPAGKTEHANDRGTRIHTGAELFVKGGVELLPELEAFRTEFEALRTMHAKGKVSLEGEWCMNPEWEPTAWSSRDAWLRLKLDAMVTMSPSHAIVIDYKTGRKHGNEIKHAEQGQLYQLTTFLRYPELQTIDVEFWYTDQDEITHMTYTRSQGMRFFNNYNKRGQIITSTNEFPANPNMFSCKWCPYGPRGTGHCTQGV